MNDILIVENDPVSRKALRCSLEGEGYQVREAENGASALRELRERTPAAILLDIVLPDWDGRELAREVRKAERYRGVPVIAVSGLVEDPGFEDFEEFLPKPVSRAQLLGVLEAILRKQTPADVGFGVGKCVLLADDDATQRAMLANILAGLGYRVAMARDGKEALQRARELHPDLIVSDVVMPRLDGFNLCAAIRADKDLSGVPVILATSVLSIARAQEFAAAVGASALVADWTDGESLRRQLTLAVRS